MLAIDDKNVLIATGYTSKPSALVLVYKLINDPWSDPDLRQRSYRLDGDDEYYFGSVAMSEDRIYIGGMLKFDGLRLTDV